MNSSSGMTSSSGSFTDKDNERSLFHKCLICARRYRQHKLHESTSHDHDNNRMQCSTSSNNVDEFEIFFALEVCFGISAEESKIIFKDLVTSVGKPCNWRVSFCKDHTEVVKQAKEIHNKLLDLKKTLRDDALMSFENYSGYEYVGNCTGYNEFRTTFQNVLIPNADTITEDSEEVENVILTTEQSISNTETEEDTKYDLIDLTDDPIIIVSDAEPELQEANVGLCDTENDNNTINGNQSVKNVNFSPSNNLITAPVEVKNKKRKSKEPNCSTRLKRSIIADKSIVELEKTNPTTRNSQPIFMCLYCLLPYQTEAERNEHQNSSHDTTKEALALVCIICGKAFRSIFQLNMHKAKAHKSLNTLGLEANLDKCDHQQKQSPKKIICPICQKEYSKMSSLKRHIQQKHSPAPAGELGEQKLTDTFFCNLCSKTYSSPGALSTHQLKEHKSGGEIRDYPSVCDTDGNRLPTSEHLSNPQGDDPPVYNERKNRLSSPSNLNNLYVIDRVGSCSQRKGRNSSPNGSIKSSTRALDRLDEKSRKTNMTTRTKTNTPTTTSRVSSASKPARFSKAKKYQRRGCPNRTNECISCGQDFEYQSQLRCHMYDCRPFA